jgi:hypothetical protein
MLDILLSLKDVKSNGIAVLTNSVYLFSSNAFKIDRIF